MLHEFRTLKQFFPMKRLIVGDTKRKLAFYSCIYEQDIIEITTSTLLKVKGTRLDGKRNSNVHSITNFSFQCHILTYFWLSNIIQVNVNMVHKGIKTENIMNLDFSVTFSCFFSIVPISWLHTEWYDNPVIDCFKWK